MKLLFPFTSSYRVEYVSYLSLPDAVKVINILKSHI